MARILFAWELGGELGHASSCASLAAPLALRGHGIAMAFRELRAASFLRNLDAYELFQAPVLMDEGQGAGIPFTYSDLLWGSGYGSPEVLAALLAGWRALLEAWRPDLVISDFAPTSLIAARLLGIRTAIYSNGFSAPPLLTPMPPFRFDTPVDPARVARHEAEVLAHVNAALSALGGAPRERLADHLAADAQFLCTFPELDHYRQRQQSGYWGPRFEASAGARVAWPRGRGRRILVYVKPGMAQIDALIDALVAGGHRVLAFIPDLDEARRARLAGPGRVVATQPIRLDGLLRECDLVVSHGGNIAPGTLCMGVPQLIFPTQYEQFLTALRISELGAGAFLVGTAGDVRATLEAILAQPRFAQAARAFRARYPAYSPPEQRRRVVAHIEQLLDRRLPPGGPETYTPSVPQRGTGR